MPDIVPVDHDPFEGADPFEMAAARTREGVMPASGRQQQGILSNVAPAAVQGLVGLPERAMHAAGDLQRTGDVYDPAPAVETALTTMGVPGMAGPVEGMALGSGITRPIRAYHGSPHDWERPDLSKIGTGEGSQSFGHGFYAAENETVARGYRDALSRANATPAERNAAQILQDKGNDRTEAIKWLEQNTEWQNARGDAVQAKNNADAIGLLKDPDWKLGHMYELNINAHPEHFLDWDRPLSEQPAAVQKMVRENANTSSVLPSDLRVMDALQKDPRWKGKWDEDRTWRHIRDTFPNLSEGAMQQIADRVQQHIMLGTIPETFSGQRIHMALTSKYGAERTAQMLHEAGVPGIRYLDQGSRAAGAGTSNYVVFNDKLIDVVKKYVAAGMAPAAAMEMAKRSGGSAQVIPVDHQPEF